MRRSTLCWKCQRAVGLNMCEWADRFEPVEGWDAEETSIQLHANGIVETTQSFMVRSCPKFIPDKRL
jgi:hypothetical protein